MEKCRISVSGNDIYDHKLSHAPLPTSPWFHNPLFDICRYYLYHQDGLSQHTVLLLCQEFLIPTNKNMEKFIFYQLDDSLVPEFSYAISDIIVEYKEQWSVVIIHKPISKFSDMEISYKYTRNLLIVSRACLWMWITVVKLQSVSHKCPMNTHENIKMFWNI